MGELSDLEREIEEIRTQEKHYGWLNNTAAYFLATVAIVGSVGGSALAAFGVAGWLTAIVAAIPAAVAAVARIFPFETRAVAHWRKEYRVHALLLKLKFEGVDARAVSQEFREIESTTFEQWPLLAPIQAEGKAAPSDGSPEKG